MPTIQFTFPAGRYHATLNGTHVNEGQIEWPPSPWRLLRLLLAVGYTKLNWDAPPPEAIRLIEKLASVLPSYRLPRATEAHTRHYMPILEGKTEKRAKVLDTFLRFEDDLPLLVHYDIELDSDSVRVLSQLTSAVTYLGRAETWADAELVEAPVELDESWWRPSTTESCHNDGDPVELAASLSSEDYAVWRREMLQHTLEQETSVQGKKLTAKAKQKVESAFPADLMACLQWDTAEVKQHRWSRAPGMRIVPYARPALESAQTSKISSTCEAKPVEAGLVRLAIDREHASRLPLMSQCVRQAEALHMALVAVLKKQDPAIQHSDVLIGRDRLGNPLNGNHQHAHFLPLDLDCDGCIDHMVIHAPMLLDDAAQLAIRHLRSTWAKGIPRIVVRWVGFGSLNDLRNQLRLRGNQLPPVLGSSNELHSISPYVPPRRLKPHNNRYTLEDDICRELECRGLPLPSAIEVWNRDPKAGHNLLTKTKLLSYARRRMDGRPQPPVDCAYGLTLRFDQRIQCPLAIGYGSHFGLGLFGAREG